MSATANAWREAHAQYLRLLLEAPDNDDAICETLDHLVSEVVAPSAGAVAIKFDLALERAEGGSCLFDEHVVAIRQDLWRLDEQDSTVARAWFKLWSALHCRVGEDGDGEVRLWIPEGSIIAEGRYGLPEDDCTIWLSEPQPGHLRINSQAEWEGAKKALHILLRGLDDSVVSAIVAIQKKGA
jgi:hypothetical protein